MISGADGFIGTALVKNLKDHTIFTIKHSNRFAQEKNQFTLDLTNPSHCDKLIDKTRGFKIETFVHLASKKQANFSDDFKMAKIVAEICQSLSIKRLLFSSGWVVYSPNAKVPITENSKTVPITDYGKSKLKAENYFLENLKGLQVIILRISSVYGPGMQSKGLIPTLAKAATNGQEMHINSTARRDYLYIDDLVKVFRNLIRLKTHNKLTLNIGSGESAEILKIAKMIKRILKRNFKIDSKINFLESTLPVPKDNLLDITKARKILSLKKFHKLDRGLTSYIKWYLNKKS